MTSAKRKKTTQPPRDETIKEYLARGGKITKCPPSAADGAIFNAKLMWGTIKRKGPAVRD